MRVSHADRSAVGELLGNLQIKSAIRIGVDRSQLGTIRKYFDNAPQSGLASRMN
jgi:hypothetical protein